MRKNADCPPPPPRAAAQMSTQTHHKGHKRVVENITCEKFYCLQQGTPKREKNGVFIKSGILKIFQVPLSGSNFEVLGEPVTWATWA